MIHEPSMHAGKKVGIHKKNVEEQNLPVPLKAVMIQPRVSLSSAIPQERGTGSGVFGKRRTEVTASCS